MLKKLSLIGRKPAEGVTVSLGGSPAEAASFSAGLRKVANEAEAYEAMDGLMEYFQNDTNKFLVFLGKYMAKEKPSSTPAVNNLMAGLVEPAPSAATSEEDAELLKMQQQRRKVSLLNVRRSISASQNKIGRRLSQLEMHQEMVKSAVEIAAIEEDEDIKAEEMEKATAKPGEEAEESEEEEEEVFKYLPYRPVLGDEVDEALALKLNDMKLDVDVKRTKNAKKKTRNTKRGYKLDNNKYEVRLVHGILVCKTSGDSKWTEFIPVLTKHYEKTNAAPELPTSSPPEL